MKVVDLNLLIYATNSDSTHHKAAKDWLNEAFAATEPIGFSWAVVLGFLRLATRPVVFPRPLSVEQAATVVDDWLDRPNTKALTPGERHWGILRSLLLDAGTAGNLTTDAHLAALAIEYSACLYSTDNDFARFGCGLKFKNPLVP